MYWSTTDARKRCVYTCKVVECRPPVVEPDINSTVEHDENRTIAHSPASAAGSSLVGVALERARDALPWESLLVSLAVYPIAGSLLVGGLDVSLGRFLVRVCVSHRRNFTQR